MIPKKRFTSILNALSNEDSPVSFTVMANAIETSRLRILDPLGRRNLANDNGSEDKESKAFALKVLEVHYDVMHPDEPDENPDDDSYWEETPLNMFGWVEDELPDFELVDPNLDNLDIEEIKEELTKNSKKTKFSPIKSMDQLVPEVANPSTVTGVPSSAQTTDVFRKMKNLTAVKLSIAFVGDKPDSGMGNTMLEISAMDETRRVPLAELDLVDRRSGSLNHQGAILLGMAKKTMLKNSPENSKKMQRLRAVFKKHLGIESDPFYPFNKYDGWKPIFRLENKLGAKDERARREGEFKTESWEQRNELGEKVSAYHESNDMDENDEASDWIKEREGQL